MEPQNRTRIARGVLMGLISLVGLAMMYRSFSESKDEIIFAEPQTNLIQKVESPYERNFPENKILTVSAIDYVESIGKKLGDFDMIGVRGDSAYLNFPEGTERVVDYKPINLVYGVGTALIPKRKQ